MSDLGDLTWKVCRRLGIQDPKQVQCIEDILKNTILFNEYRVGSLDESQLESFITLLGGYVSEISMISDDPDSYKAKVERIKQQIQVG